MPFQPNPNDELTIDGSTYRIAEHPAAPGMPHGQEGRAGTVYRLEALTLPPSLLPSPAGWERGGGAAAGGGEGVRAALKVFKPRFRLPYLVAQAERIAPFADLSGLAACRRTVLTPQRHAALLRRHPDLTYAVLMPWIEGPTWQEVLLAKEPLLPEQALALARGLAEVLMRMEERGIAHGDLSAPNVLLPALAPFPTPNPQSPVALVDLEGLYVPGMLRPQALSSGSAGYAHRQAADGLWGPEADRFAGALLLAEMLGWCDPLGRPGGSPVQAAWGESYFDPQEMQQDCPRYRLLVDSLRRNWGEGVAALFERAWRSDTLADCPTFGEWVMALPERPPVGAERRSALAGAPPPAGEEPGVESTDLVRAQVQALMEAARRLEEKGNLDGALETYRQAQALADAEPALAALAQEIVLIGQVLEKRRQRVQAPPEPSPAPPPTGVEPGAEQHRRRWGVVGVVLMLAAIVGAISWSWWQRQQEMMAQAQVAAALAQYEATRATEALAATTTAIAAEQATATAQTQAIATARAAELATSTIQAQATATARARATATAHARATATAQARDRATQEAIARAATATAQAPTAAPTPAPTATPTPAPTATPTPRSASRLVANVTPCPPYLHKPLPGMGLLVIENHIGEPLHIDYVGTAQFTSAVVVENTVRQWFSNATKWDLPPKKGDIPSRLVLDLPPGRHTFVDNTPKGQGRVHVEIKPGLAFISPIWYNGRTEEFVFPLEIPNGCK